MPKIARIRGDRPERVAGSTPRGPCCAWGQSGCSSIAAFMPPNNPKADLERLLSRGDFLNAKNLAGEILRRNPRAG